jgi:hypothetical protein
MPRLVLLDDDGRQLFSGDVSQANVSALMGFLRRNATALRAMAAVRAAWSSVFGQPELAAPTRPPPTRRKALATYTPPKKSRR